MNSLRAPITNVVGTVLPLIFSAAVMWIRGYNLWQIAVVAVLLGLLSLGVIVAVRAFRGSHARFANEHGWFFWGQEAPEEYGEPPVAARDGARIGAVMWGPWRGLIAARYDTDANEGGLNGQTWHESVRLDAVLPPVEIRPRLLGRLRGVAVMNLDGPELAAEFSRRWIVFAESRALGESFVNPAMQRLLLSRDALRIPLFVRGDVIHTAFTQFIPNTTRTPERLDWLVAVASAVSRETKATFDVRGPQAPQFNGPKTGSSFTPVAVTTTGTRKATSVAILAVALVVVAAVVVVAIVAVK